MAGYTVPGFLESKRQNHNCDLKTNKYTKENNKNKQTKIISMQKTESSTLLDALSMKRRSTRRCNCWGKCGDYVVKLK